MPILGADISYYQGRTGMPAARWDQFKALGVGFVGIRATIGRGTDPAFTANVQRAKARDIIPMGYHYLTHGNAIEQAQRFAAVIGDLPGWLDVEERGVDRRDVTLFAREFHARKPDGFLGVYSSAYKWRSLTGNMDGASLFDACWNALWTERGTDNVKDLPAGAPKPRWGGFHKADIWQFGPLHLTHGIVDGDAFYGSHADLLALLGLKERVPMDERPRRIRAYNEQLDAIARAVSLSLTPPGTGAAWQDGITDARADALEAIGELRLTDPAA